jgi:exopolysaccharide biosynthesis polyprenyl glycosylphosphotransferase
MDFQTPDHLGVVTSASPRVADIESLLPGEHDVVELGERTTRPAVAAVHRQVVGISVALSDALCPILSLIVMRSLSGAGPDGARFIVLLGASSLLWIFVFRMFNLYDLDHLSAFEEFRRIVSAASVAAGFIVLALWSNGSATRAALLAMLLLGLVAELAVRRLWRWNRWRLCRSGYLSTRAVVVGTNDEARRMAAELSDKNSGFEVVGHVLAHAPSNGTGGLPIVGRLAGLEDVVREVGVDCVFVASNAVTSDDVAAIASLARRTHTQVRFSTTYDARDVLTSRVSLQAVQDFMILSFAPARVTGFPAVAKRALDVAVGTAALIILLPLMSVVALAVRLTSPGPIFFCQDRVTKDGQVFRMYKFRTMVVDQADRLDDRVIDLTAPFFKLADDPRLTRVGKLLRSTSLDELPQLWNVLRGQLSLVGPRPLPVEQVVSNASVEGMQLRHEVRAGLSGWWQINGRSGVTPEEALRMDLFYINNWSFALDLFILLKTVGAVLARSGAQ